MSNAIEQKSWFSRNWLWVVPASGCLVLVLLLVFGVGAAIFGVSKLLTGTEPYEYAMERAKTNDEVIAILGEPVEANGIMQGNIAIKNSKGEADLRIPIKGPKGTASVIVKAEKYDGEWDYHQLYVEIKATQEKIHLIAKRLEGL